VRNRTLPVYINRGYTDEDEIVYSFPDGYTVEAKPDDRQIISQFGSYTIRTTIEGKKLVYKRKLVLNNGAYSVEKYADLTAFFNEVSSLDNSKVIFKAN
jgi:hypothetical protein